MIFGLLLFFDVLESNDDYHCGCYCDYYCEYCRDCHCDYHCKYRSEYHCEYQVSRISIDFKKKVVPPPHSLTLTLDPRVRPTKRWNALRDSTDNSLVHAVCAIGAESCLELLLLSGIQLDVVNAKGYSPLMIAMQYRRHEMVKVLLCARTKMTLDVTKFPVPQDNGRVCHMTCFTWALVYKEWTLAHLLLERGYPFVQAICECFQANVFHFGHLLVHQLPDKRQLHRPIDSHSRTLVHHLLLSKSSGTYMNILMAIDEF